MFTHADKIKQFDGYVDEKNRDEEREEKRGEEEVEEEEKDKEKEVGGAKKKCRIRRSSRSRTLIMREGSDLEDLSFRCK